MRARQVVLTVLAASTFAASPAFADSDGQATFGWQGWLQTAPEAKFREFRDLPRGAFLETFLLRDRTGNLSSTLWGANGGRLDESYGLSVARGASWRADAKYQEIPHLFSQVAQSPYTEVSPGIFRLPDSLQRVNQEYPGNYVPTMNDLLATAGGVPLLTGSSIAQARLRSRPTKGWRFELRGQERRKNGHQAMNGTFGFSHTIELAAPVAYRTQDGDAIASYEQGKFRVQAVAGVSRFMNEASELVWDNPKRYTDDTTRTNPNRGPKSGRIDLAPDNTVVRGAMTLGVRLPRAAMLAATLSVSEGRQDDAFIPYTINSLLPQNRLDSLPASSLDGRMRTVTQDYRLSGRPLRSVWGVLRYHDDQVTSETPEMLFTGLSVTDQSFSVNPKENSAFGSGRSTLGTDINVNLTDWAGLSLLAEYRHRTRTDREVEADNEGVIGGNLDMHPGDSFRLTAGIRQGDRQEESFDAQFMTSSGDRANLRRYDVANRKQTAALGTVEYMIGSRIQAVVDYTFTENKYGDTQLGLQSSKEHLVIGDATYALTDRIELNLGYGYNQLDTRQASQQSGSATLPATDWWADLRDQTVFVYSRDSWWAVPKKLRLAADYTFTRALGTYDLSNAPKSPLIPAAVDLPSTLYRRHELILESSWAVQPKYDLSARFGYDQYDVTDFATENIPLLGITGTGATAVYLGDYSQSYVAHRYMLLMTRRF